jgi:predicted N-acetyltransferase YhbS
MRVSLGPFDLIHPAGKGGMGTVWRGVHRGRGTLWVAEPNRRMGLGTQLVRSALADLFDRGHAQVTASEGAGFLVPQGFQRTDSSDVWLLSLREPAAT